MTNLMQDLYGRLEAAGLDRQWVKRAALPNWWEDRLAQNPAGYAEALSLLADHLSLNLRDLQDPSRPLQCEPFLAMRNKTRDFSFDTNGVSYQMRVGNMFHGC